MQKKELYEEQDVYSDGDYVGTRTYYAYFYHFTTPQGMTYEDVSIGGDRIEVQSEHGVSVYKTEVKGSKAVVEYPVGKPHLARIRGLRREIYGPGKILPPLVLLLSGLTIIVLGVKKGVSTRHQSGSEQD